MRPLGLSFTYQSAFCSISDSLMCRHVYGRPISSSAMETFHPLGVSDVSISIMRRQPLAGAGSIVARRGRSGFHPEGTKTRPPVPSVHSASHSVSPVVDYARGTWAYRGPMQRAEEQPWPSPRRAWYALAVLTVALMVSTIDRSILSLLVGPIKHDLGVTDTQMSLLLGMAFVSIYAFLGLPVARLSDVSSRRRIIGIGIAFWSAMTALSGVVHTYLQLFLARVGVGAGEASFAPATYSMLTDSFPKEKLPRAMAVLSIGFTAGSGLALILGGWVIHLVTGVPPVTLPLVGTIHSWQLVFFAVG